MASFYHDRYNCQCEHESHFDGRHHSYNAAVGGIELVTFSTGGIFQFCRSCREKHGPTVLEELERCDDCGQRSCNHGEYSTYVESFTNV